MILRCVIFVGVVLNHDEPTAIVLLDINRYPEIQFSIATQLLSFDKGPKRNYRHCQYCYLKIGQNSLSAPIVIENCSSCMGETWMPHLTCHWLSNMPRNRGNFESADPGCDASHFRDIYLATSSC